MKPPHTTPEYVAVACPLCGTRMFARPDRAGQKIACPDCRTVCTVPAIAPPRLRRTQADVGEYRVVQPDEPAPAARTWDQSPGLLECRICGARVEAAANEPAANPRCPDCGAQSLARRQRPKQATPRPPAGDYDVADAPPERASRPLVSEFALPVKSVTAVPLPPPPRRTFLSGVFHFPWYRGTAPRWGWMSFGLALFGEAAMATLEFSGVLGGGVPMGAVAAGFFGLAAIWLGIMSLSYAASCCLAVVQDTAYGADRIEHWPEPNFREWFWSLVHVAFVIGLCLLAGYGARQLAALAIADTWWVLPATTFLLFPVVLLSSLEAGSVFVPLSLPVLTSMGRLWWGWLVFYAETGVVCGAWAWLFLRGVAEQRYLTVLAASPPLAAALLIYARLLGRLAWRAGSATRAPASRTREDESRAD